MRESGGGSRGGAELGINGRAYLGENDILGFRETAAEQVLHPLHPLPLRGPPEAGGDSGWVLVGGSDTLGGNTGRLG
jgi:hypothetical protein